MMLSKQNAIPLETEPLTWMFWKKKRYIVLVMVFFGMANVLALRVNLSVAIVAMTEVRQNDFNNGTIVTEQDFQWDTKQVGIVLSSFFYGFILTPILGGFLGNNYGNAIGFSLGAGATCFLTLLTPLAAKTGFYYLIGLRAIIGLLEGISYPCMYGIWAKWAPPCERARITSISYSGAHIGTVISMFLSGVLAREWGWESIFYVFGSVGCIWYILWIVIVRDTPENDRHISADELRYITDSVQSIPVAVNESIPWKCILTSPAVFAICVAHFAETWGFFTFLTHLPSFLKDTLSFNIANSGFLAAAPYFAYAVLLPICGYVSDKLISTRVLTIGQTRKYYTCSAFVMQTSFLLLCAYLKNPIGSVFCIIFAVALGSFAYSGFGVNFFDIAPQYAGLLMGVSCTGAILPGIISPTLTGYIVQHKTTDEWRIIFYIASGINLIGFIVYWCCSSGELQSWAKLNQASNEENQKKIQEIISKQHLDSLDVISKL